jgi:hypothetical protein
MIRDNFLGITDPDEPNYSEVDLQRMPWLVTSVLLRLDLKATNGTVVASYRRN